MNNRSLVMARDGFRLYIGDPIRKDGHSMFDKVDVPYQLFDDEFDGPRPIFSGSDFSPGASMSTDGDRAICTLLSFLSLRSGDTDDEYFSDYTADQLQWRDERAEKLSWIVSEAEGAIEKSGEVAVFCELVDDGTMDTVFEVFDCMTGEATTSRHSSEGIRFEDPQDDSESISECIAEIIADSWQDRELFFESVEESIDE